MLTADELRASIIARANTDREFRAALLTRTRQTIRRLAGKSIPEGFTFHPFAELEISADDLRAAIVSRARSNKAFRRALIKSQPDTIIKLVGGLPPDGFEFNIVKELKLTDAEMEIVLLSGGLGGCKVCMTGVKDDGSTPTS